MSPIVLQESIAAFYEQPLPHVVDSAANVYEQQSASPLREILLVQLCSAFTTSELCVDKVEDLWTIYTNGSCNRAHSSIGYLSITLAGE